jgi:aryl-phospho-beta-D-glucosidase BglC (GH1 family)
MLQISKKWVCCRQYRQQSYVIGYDLRNEPRGIPAQIASKLQLSPQGVA